MDIRKERLGQKGKHKKDNTTMTMSPRVRWPRRKLRVGAVSSSRVSSRGREKGWEGTVRRMLCRGRLQVTEKGRFVSNKGNYRRQT